MHHSCLLLITKPIANKVRFNVSGSVQIRHKQSLKNNKLMALMKNKKLVSVFCFKFLKFKRTTANY